LPERKKTIKTGGYTLRKRRKAKKKDGKTAWKTGIAGYRVEKKTRKDKRQRKAPNPAGRGFARKKKKKKNSNAQPTKMGGGGERKENH